MSRQRFGAIAALVLLVSQFGVATAAPRIIATVGLNKTVYWNAAKTAPVEEPAYYGPSMMGQANAAVDNARGLRNYRFDFYIRVAAGGSRLRIAWDAPNAFEWHHLTLLGPGGQHFENDGFNSGEQVVHNPFDGVWLARVYSGTPKRDFRMRARLDGAVRKSTSSKPLLPNLRLIPPFEFTFANPYRGSFRFQGSGAVPAPHGTANCWWDEVVEHQARKCLRFSLGPINTGDGPLRLTFDGSANGGGLVTDVPVTQIIHRANGSTYTREAGVAQYHKTHMHYHHTGFGTLELFKVTGRNRMEKVGDGPKQGFCTADIVLYQWNRFAGLQNEAPSECLGDMVTFGTFAPTGTGMGITQGWGDIYDWSQSGNYVEFGDNGDGRYVVRSTTDAGGLVLESNERDNTSYALIEITGTSIKVLERGFGMSPWDRNKQLARDILRPVPAGFES